MNQLNQAPNQAVWNYNRAAIPSLESALAGTEWMPTSPIAMSNAVAVMLPALTLIVHSKESTLEAIDQVAEFVTSPGYRAMAQLWLGRDPQHLQLRTANVLSPQFQQLESAGQVISFFSLKPARVDGYPSLGDDRVEAHAAAVGHIEENFRDTHVRVRCYRRYASEIIQSLKLEQAEIERRRAEMQRSQAMTARQMQADWDQVLRESTQLYGYRPNTNMLGSLIGDSLPLAPSAQPSPPDNSLKTWVAGLMRGKSLSGK